MIAGDEPVLVDGLLRLMNRRGEMRVIGSGTTVAAALETVRSLRPDVLLTDYRMPDGEAAGLTAVVVAEQPGTKVIVLIDTVAPEGALRCIAAGCSGVIAKTAPVDDVARAIQRVHNGEVVIPAALLVQVVAGSHRTGRSLGDDLTRRERNAVASRSWSNAAGHRSSDVDQPEHSPQSHAARAREVGRTFQARGCGHSEAGGFDGGAAMTSHTVVDRAQWGLLMEMVPGAIIGVDEKGVILFANSDAASVFGYRRDELVGQPVERLLPGVPSRGALRTAVLRRSTAIRVHDDGGAADSPSEGRDRVSQRDRAGMESVGRRSRRDARGTGHHGTEAGQGEVPRVVEVADDAAVGVDRAGLIARVNTEAEELFGYTRAELMDQPIAILVPQLLPAAPDHAASPHIRVRGTLELGAGRPLEGRRKGWFRVPGRDLSFSARYQSRLSRRRRDP